jgi:acyl-CoA dehydrogenase
MMLRSWEAVYRWCGAHRWIGYHALAHWARGPSHVLAHAAPATRDRLLPILMAGTESLCFAMSEPDAGSDAWRMRTSATRTGAGGWVLNGTKQWITNGPYADHILVFAVTDPAAANERNGGVTAFLVPADAPGVRVDSVIKMFGHAGGDEAILSFDDVALSDEAVVGELGRGFPLAMSGVSLGRVYNTGRAVGLARWALEQTIEYAGDRTTFGKPIIDNQAVSFPLVDRLMEVSAAWQIGLTTARKLDAGTATAADVAMAKAVATESATKAVDTAVQIHGAMGFTNELGLAEAWQQVRRICVADGTSEILRRSIVRELRRGWTPW